MVHLDRITTKTGDRGTTRLGDGTEVKKSDLRIEVLGTIDELSATLGMSLSMSISEPYNEWLRQIQNDLFDLGADICFPPTVEPAFPPKLTKKQTDRLEQWLEELHQQLPPLSSFILPGGASAPASLHWSRTVCRRAERVVCQLHQSESVEESILIYLNRLSDLLFQMARILEDPAQPAPLWKPSS